LDSAGLSTPVHGHGGAVLLQLLWSEALEVRLYLLPERLVAVHRDLSGHLAYVVVPVGKRVGRPHVRHDRVERQLAHKPEFSDELLDELQTS